jgi:hypothetical protein
MGNGENPIPKVSIVPLGSSSMLNIATDVMSRILPTPRGPQAYMAFSKSHSYREPECPPTTSTSAK